MKTISEIEKRREVILGQMREIRSMERGTINQHFVPVRKKGQRELERKGPYYVISRREENKTKGYHLKGAEEVETALRTAVLAAGARMGSAGLTAKPLLTILGEVELTRSRYQCPECGATGFTPRRCAGA